MKCTKLLCGKDGVFFSRVNVLTKRSTLKYKYREILAAALFILRIKLQMQIRLIGLSVMLKSVQKQKMTTIKLDEVRFT